MPLQTVTPTDVPRNADLTLARPSWAEIGGTLPRPAFADAGLAAGDTPSQDAWNYTWQQPARRRALVF